jgi:four helix bundle protein
MRWDDDVVVMSLGMFLECRINAVLSWQKAHALAVLVNEVTHALARSDRSGLVSQVRRAALSIPSNIAEGCSRPTDRDFAKFLQIAIASATELE